MKKAVEFFDSNLALFETKIVTAGSSNGSIATIRERTWALNLPHEFFALLAESQPKVFAKLFGAPANRDLWVLAQRNGAEWYTQHPARGEVERDSAAVLPYASEDV